MEKIKKIILKYCLQNAIFYNGKAEIGAVLGKVLASEPDLRGKIKWVNEEISKAVKEVNKLSLEQQKAKLEKIAPELLEKKIKVQEELPTLPNAVPGKVVTRFAPAPTGPLSISHMLRAVMLSYLYAKKYKGKFILRFEDSDARNIKKEYYGFILEDLLTCSVKWNKLVKESDRLEICYKHAKEMIEKGKTYICTCKAAQFKKLKLAKKECECRNNSVKTNLERWEKMFKAYKEGEAVVRLKTSMQASNPALRDPPLLRIIEAEHPIKGKKYRVWPLYNYACVIEDHLEDITHVFRGKEHEHNTAIQSEIYKIFNWQPPVVVNFGMIYLPGKKIHTREIKKWIQEGKVKGWDDVKLPTVKALLRRGFQPEAFKKFAMQCGLTKTDIILSWENLEGINRKLIDHLANRYSVVIDPVKISIKDAPKIKVVKLDLHPDFPKRGKRELPVDLNNIYISKQDFEQFKGKKIRLIGFGNIELDRVSKYIGKKIEKDMQKIQWVSEPNIKVEILNPEKDLKGLAEPSLKRLRIDSLIQMERIGFARIDKIDKEKITICFAHK